MIRAPLFWHVPKTRPGGGDLGKIPEDGAISLGSEDVRLHRGKSGLLGRYLGDWNFCSMHARINLVREGACGRVQKREKETILEIIN